MVDLISVGTALSLLAGSTFLGAFVLAMGTALSGGTLALAATTLSLAGAAGAVFCALGPAGWFFASGSILLLLSTLGVTLLA